MAYKKIVKEQAKELFLQGRTLEEIAKITTVPERTLMRWRKEHKWEDAEKSASPLGLVYKLQKAFNETLNKALDEDKLGDPKVADTLVKLASIMERTIPRKMMLVNILNMLTDLTAYFQTHVDDD